MDGMWKWNFLICSGEIVAMQQNPVVSEWDKRLCGGREMSCNSSRKYCENLSYHMLSIRNMQEVLICCALTLMVSLQLALEQNPFFCCSRWGWYL